MSSRPCQPPNLFAFVVQHMTPTEFHECGSLGVPGTDSETEIRVQDIFRGLLLQYQHLWKGREGKTRKENWTEKEFGLQCSFFFFFFSFLFLILAGSGLSRGVWA